MATKHWCRDGYISDPNNYIANGNHARMNALVFHFLRNAGWSHIWECDGEVGPLANDCNHVADGSMEDPTSPPVTYWPAVGTAIVTKDTTTVYTGSRSLKIISLAPGDGAQSSQLRNMLRAGNGNIGGTAPNMQMNDTPSNLFSQSLNGGFNNITFVGATNPGNNGTFPIASYIDENSINFTNGGGVAENGVDWATDEPYQTVFHANNPSLATFTVQVDRGDGSWFTIGTIPPNGGVWTRYQFPFTLYPGLDSTNPRYIRFVDLATGSGATIYIDGLHIYRSIWEDKQGNQYGSDGILTNPDQFSTLGSYAPGATDVGKWLFVWDPTTDNKNSGWYKIITDLGGGVVQVDLRSPTAAFTTTPGGSPINWRIVDVEGDFVNNDYDRAYQAGGFGLESPHSSKQRFFLRQYQPNGQNTKGSEMWGAPEDTDFNVDTGNFFKSGPSTLKSRSGPYEAAATTALPIHKWRGTYTYKTSPTVTRAFLMTDVDGSFFTIFNWGDDGQHGHYFFGYTGADAERPGIMEWVFAARFEVGLGQANEVRFDNNAAAPYNEMSSIDENGEAVTACVAQLFYDSDTPVLSQSNAGANPWSGNEWMHKLFIADDPTGQEGHSVEGDSDCGVYQMRSNMTERTTFDSEAYFHVDNGLVWEWSGEQLQP